MKSSVPARAQQVVAEAPFTRWVRCAALCALVVACGPGPTVYLGSLGARDGGVEDAAVNDAGAKDAGRDDDRDGDDDDDDDDVPCSTDDVCRGTKEPYCHPRREVCVECLRDEHCPAGERCEDDGECDDN